MTSTHDYGSLREWLVKALKPIVDGEPSALAKYVVALIKKDKPTSELRTSCQEQLEVFLNDATTQFVDKLFDVLENKSYIDNNDDGTIKANIVDSRSVVNAEEYVPELPKDRHGKTMEGHDRGIRGVDKNQSLKRPSAKDRLGRRYDERDDRKPVREDERRSRSARHDYTRQPRHKRSPIRWSPPNRFTNRLGRRYSGKKRSFSPRRSHSRSPLRHTRSRSLSKSPVSTSSSLASSPKRRARSSGKNSRSSTPRPDPLTVEGKNSKRNRCRDYDEKGYCFRGDQCPYDHGYDPVVVDDVNLTSVLGYPGQRPAAPPPPHPVPAPIIPQSFPHPPPIGPPFGAPNMFDPSQHPPYNTRPFLRPFNDSPKKMHQSNLVNIPTEGKMGNRTQGESHKQSTSLEVRKIPAHLNNISKLNQHFSKFGIIKNLQVCYENDPSAAVITFRTRDQAEAAYKSPMPVLNNRFIKVFWHNFTVQYAGGAGGSGGGGGGGNTGNGKGSVRDRLGPLPEQEKEDLPKVVLPQDVDRKKFKNDNSQDIENKQEDGGSDGAPEDKSGNKESGTPAVMTKRTLIRKPTTKMLKEQRKEMMKKSLDFEKKKRSLIESLIQEQKKILLKIDGSPKGEEKNELIKTVKQLQSTIAKMTEELEKGIDAKKKAAENEKNSTTKKRPPSINIAATEANGSKKPKLLTTPVLSSPLDAKRKLLDTELDLIYASKSKALHEVEAETTELDDRNALRIRLAQLKSQAAALGLATPSVATRSLDKRTKRVQVVGCREENEKQKVLKIIQHCAKVQHIEDSEDCNEFIVEFNTRTEAEKAIKSASQMLSSGTSVSFNWVQLAEEAVAPPHPVTTENSNALKSPTGNVNVSQEEASAIAAHLLQDEEDDDEDRSWRR